MQNISPWTCGSTIGFVLALSACSGGTFADTYGTAVSQQAATLAYTSRTTPNYAAAIRAAKNAAATDPLCDVGLLGDFCCEIGGTDNAQPIVSNAAGNGSVTGITSFNIASASKLVFGAYVLKKKGMAEIQKRQRYCRCLFQSRQVGILFKA